MHFPTVLQTVALGLAGAAQALTTLPGTLSSALNTRASNDCEQRQVYFHFNDSSIGSMASCTWDVLGLAAHPLPGVGTVVEASSAPSTNTRRHDCPPPACVDGPNTTHIVASGDTLQMIAVKFNSGICNIVNASAIVDPEFLRVGQNLTVPTNVCSPDNKSCVKPPGMRPCVPLNEHAPANVTIKAGDTFYKLGQKYNVTADAFVVANYCLNPNTIQIGQEVVVPLCPKCPKDKECKRDV